MEKYTLYRKRFIPDETVLLKDDVILQQTSDFMITSWKALKPRGDIARGISLYLLQQGIKISKVFDHEDKLVYWYCDIVTYEMDEKNHTMVVIDLLADVIIYPNGSFEVRDLDELADASEQHLITQDMVNLSLRNLNWLLTQIQNGDFMKLQTPLEQI